MIRYNSPTSSSEPKVRLSGAWRVFAAVVLFAGLGWLMLNHAASGAPEPIDTKPAGREMLPGSLTTIEATLPFSLTVLNTNDTWGYLDPCG